MHGWTWSAPLWFPPTVRRRISPLAKPNTTVRVKERAVSHVLPANPSTAAPPSAPTRWRWGALVLLCVAQFMVILDVTVVNVALPAIGADLRLDRAMLTWIVTAYTLTLGGLLLLGGR